jgi:Methylmalonic aciduria and homocystinuria type D protein
VQAIHTHYQQPYSEVQGLQSFRGYKVQNAGCCKVILHPKWGASMYPASLFAKAPVEVLADVLREHER